MTGSSTGLLTRRFLRQFPTLLMALIAAALNGWLPIELGFGMHFLLGSSLAYFALRHNNLLSALTIMAGAAVPTVILWGHPLAFVNLMLSIVLACVLHRRLRWSVLLSLVTYWLIVGGPLIFLGYWLLLDTSAMLAFLVLLKQGFNEIMNLALADLTFIILTRFFSLSIFGKVQINLAEFLWSAMVVVLIGVTAAIGIIEMRHSALTIVSGTRSEIQQSLTRVSLALAERLDTLRSAVESDEFAALVLSMRMSNPEIAEQKILSSYLGDSGLLLAFYDDQGYVLDPYNLMLAGESAVRIDQRQKGSLQQTSKLWVAQILDEQVLLVNLSSGIKSFPPFQEEINVLLAIPARTVDKWLEIAGARDDGWALWIDGHFLFGGSNASIDGRRVLDLLNEEPHISLPNQHSFMPLVKAWKAGTVEAAAAVPGWRQLVVSRAIPLRPYANRGFGHQIEIFQVLILNVVLATLLGLFASRSMTHPIRLFIQRMSSYELGKSTPADGIGGISFVELQDLNNEFEHMVKRHEEAIEASHALSQRLDIVLSAGAIAVFTLEGPDCRHLSINYQSAGLAQLLGSTDLAGASARDLLSSIQAADRLKIHEKLRQLPPLVDTSIEVETVLPQGASRTLFLTMRWSRAKADTLQLLGVAVDMTDRAAERAKINQAAKMATLGEMATGLAHELNQPLNVVSLSAGNALLRIDERTASEDYLRQRLQRILDQVQRATSIINHMRIFGHASDGPKVPLDVHEIIKSAASMIEHKVRLENVELKLELPQDLPKPLGQPTLLEQVLINLIKNAIDAIHARRLRDTFFREGKIVVSACATPLELLISVADNAGGMSKEVLERVFEPFFTTKDVGEGTGLGLSLSFGLIKDLGGLLEVHNGGDGAVFTVRLPVPAPARRIPS